MEVYRTSASSLGRQPSLRPPLEQVTKNRPVDQRPPQPTREAPSSGISQNPFIFPANSIIIIRTQDGSTYEGNCNQKGELYKLGIRTKDWIKKVVSIDYPIRDGYGTIIFRDGFTYEGTWFNAVMQGHVTITTQSEPDGTGTYTWPDGRKYVGECNKDEPHGRGTGTWPDGRKYEGEWVKGLRHGYGKITYLDGSTYEGTWVKGLRHGRGTYTWPDGRIYVGGYENGKRHGEGKIIIWDEKQPLVNGGTLIGYKEDVTYEKGIVYYSQKVERIMRIQNPDGSIYIGECNKEGEPHGTGTYAWPDGLICMGKFKNGEMHGKGTITFPDRSTYQGKFVNWRLHGHGRITWPDVGKYVGRLARGQMHGKGKITYLDGSTREVYFLNGELQGPEQ